MPRSQPGHFQASLLPPLPGKQVQPRKSLLEPFPRWLPHTEPSIAQPHLPELWRSIQGPGAIPGRASIHLGSDSPEPPCSWEQPELSGHATTSSFLILLLFLPGSHPELLALPGPWE